MERTSSTIATSTSASRLRSTARANLSAAGFDVLANLKPRLLTEVPATPGVRMLDGRFTAVQQSMAIRKSRPAGAAYLADFVEDVTHSGLLQGLIDKYGAHGLVVVP